MEYSVNNNKGKGNIRIYLRQQALPLDTKVPRPTCAYSTPSQDLIPTFAPVTSISVLVPTLLRRSRLRYRLQDYDSAHISVER